MIPFPMIKWRIERVLCYPLTSVDVSSNDEISESYNQQLNGTKLIEGEESSKLKVVKHKLLRKLLHEPVRIIQAVKQAVAPVVTQAST